MTEPRALRSYAIRLSTGDRPGVEHLFMLPNDDAAIEEARRILFAARRGDGGEIVEVSVGCAGPARVRWLGAWRRPVGGAARWSTAV